MRILLLLLFATTALAQEAGCHADPGVAVGWVPQELLARPLTIRSGIGSVDEKVTTESKDAQAFYNQGLAYLHSYVFIEAARSFEQALRHDPNLAMARLGLARTYLNLYDREAARRELTKAAALAKDVTPRERRRIEIFTAQLAAAADLANVEKQLAYKKTLDEALAADMNDPELWTWRGNAEERTAMGRGQRGGAASVAFYERALQVRPGHFAAHHYLIHSYEQIGQIDRALEHGAIYAKAADAVPHAHHMYGHDLRRVGRIKDAIAAFERADRLERDYFAREKIDREMDWHHPHNLDLLAGSYRHMGRLRDAERTWRDSSSIRPVTEMQAFAKMDLPAFLLGRGRVDDAIVEAQKLTTSHYKAAQSIGYVLLGEAMLAKGDVARAETHLASAEKARDEVSGDFARMAKGALHPNIETLRGAILVRKGEGEKGAEILKRMQSIYRGLPGPDAWTQALFKLELIARQAREAGDWELAEFTAKQMLEHDPAYAGSHYAMALVAKQRGDAPAAERDLAEAKRLWSEADSEF